MKTVKTVKKMIVGKPKSKKKKFNPAAFAKAKKSHFKM